MPHSFEPDRSKHSRVIDTASKKQVDNYVRVGWELIETFTRPHPTAGRGQTIVMYRIGWPRDAGEPIEPPNTGDPLKYEQGPWAN